MTEEEKRKLNELNFKDLIGMDFSEWEDADNAAQYSFDSYRRHKCHHPKITKYCTICDDKEKAEENFYIRNEGIDESFHLRNISHGSKTEDFLQAMGIKNEDIHDWKNENSVLFLMENPSNNFEHWDNGVNYGYLYEGVKNGSYNKYPARLWYWIHDSESRKCKDGYPNYFAGGEYGKLIASAIMSFRLKNAYMTNLVKCGLNKDTDKEKKNYKNLSAYNPKCIRTCCEKYMQEEMKIIHPKVIFAFGKNTFDKLEANARACWLECWERNSYYAKAQLKDKQKVYIVKMPHPARRAFNNEYYPLVYFCMMAKWLHKGGVIDDKFYYDRMSFFAQKEIANEE